MAGWHFRRATPNTLLKLVGAIGRRNGSFAAPTIATTRYPGQKPCQEPLFLRIGMLEMRLIFLHLPSIL